MYNVWKAVGSAAETMKIPEAFEDSAAGALFGYLAAKYRPAFDRRSIIVRCRFTSLRQVPHAYH
jgi:hypothetical protein